MAKTRKISDIDKNKIIKQAKSGKDANQIRKNFRCYSRQQIAGVIAWVTMGKY